MKRRLLTTIVAVSITTMIWGSVALAAPQTMSDGQVFDPEFYAQTYPDVAAAFGTDANALYQHYVTCGKAEGRLPYANADTGTTRGKATIGAGTEDASALALSDGLAAFNSLGEIAKAQNLPAIYNLAPNTNKLSNGVKTIAMAPITLAFRQWARKSLTYPSSARIISTKQATLATALAYDALNPYYSVMLNQFMTDTGIDPTYITDGKCMAFEVQYAARNALGGYVTGTMLGVYNTKTFNSWCGGVDPNSSSYVAITSLAYSGNTVIALP